MTAAASFFPKKKEPASPRKDRKPPMEIVNRIKRELEKSGMEPYFIGKGVEDLLARVYFPSVN
jgi:hypothetical protein